MVDSVWENLPAQLLDLILSKLDSCVDYLHFSLVCELWRSNAVDSFAEQKSNNRHAPLLLLPNKYIPSGDCRLYNTLDEKLLGSKLQLPYYTVIFRISSEGWFATVERNLAVTLRNPFIREEDSVILLPPLPVLPPLREIDLALFSRINKILTFTPNPLEDPTNLMCLLVLGPYSDIFYIQPRKDTEWKRPGFKPKSQWEPPVSKIFDDIVYYNNCFYALSRSDKLFTFDSFRTKPKLIRTSKVRGGDIRGPLDVWDRYLVKSIDGELLQVRKIYSPRRDLGLCILSFKVFKFCFKTCSWIKMDSLGDSALFLGNNGSISVSASRFSNCKPNHIYFTRDRTTFEVNFPRGFKFDKPADFGEYNLESERITSFGIVFPGDINSTTSLPTLQWIVPTIQF